ILESAISAPRRAGGASRDSDRAVSEGIPSGGLRCASVAPGPGAIASLEQRRARKFLEQHLDRRWKSHARRLARVIPDALRGIHDACKARAVRKYWGDDEIEVRERVLYARQSFRFPRGIVKRLPGIAAGRRHRFELRQTPQSAPDSALRSALQKH